MASLGFDPFIQNLIHYYSEQVEDIGLTALTGNPTSYNVLGFPFSAGRLRKNAKSTSANPGHRNGGRSINEGKRV